MPGTITVGLDGADPSLAAADWAAAEAARRGLRLRLVHVRRPDFASDAVTDDDRRWTESVLREGEARIARSVHGLPVEAAVVDGEPVGVLAAEVSRSVMLVLGSRGHGALVGHLLGSVSLGVLREARGPVVVVRGLRPSDAARRRDEVLVGVQDTRGSGAPLLEFAFASAAARGAVLRAVRAWSAPNTLAWSPGAIWLAQDPDGLAATHRRELAEALRPWQERYPEVDVVQRVESGPASEVLLSHCHRAALVVVGRRARDGAPHRVGAVTHAVLHHAPGPVAVVPHP
ncbi:universal stress protein [Streptomyces sp. NPDC047886]|uniref:universal stress protein n=1 Tax=Streptomyces sp. NPDC047886 TaxID=3365490 RepID=UPI00371EED01